MISVTELALSLCFLGTCLASVPTVTISPGINMPMLAFGTARDSLSGCTVQQGVEQWLALGGRHIDTADNYGTQPDVGAALATTKVPRAEIFVTTKIPGPIGKQQVIDKITKTALPQLGVTYIDLVLIHWPCTKSGYFPDNCNPSDGYAERMATWEGLEELQKDGKIRAIGVSNYNEYHVAELTQLGKVPATNQIQWHLGLHNDTFLAAMKGSGVALEAWGSLSGPTTGGDGVSLGDPRLKAVAARYNVSTAQVALRWSVHKGVTPVTATCTAEHAVGDLDSFKFDLSEVDVAYLDSLHSNKTVFYL